MKAITLSLLFIGIFISLNAQTQIATTADGRKVLLKNNETWEYVNTSSSNTKSPIKTLKKNNSIRKTNSTTRTYIRGPRGGCYYINRNGGKTYVDRSLCN